MPILLDGNNLLHRLRPGPVSRTRVRQLVLDACRRERMQVVVVFDGPPPAGTPEREHLGRVEVVYSGAESADQTIVRRIGDARSARVWVVVSDDRGLAARARNRGAEVRGLDQWLARRPPRSRGASPEPALSSREIAEWQQFFSGTRPDDPD
jgi:hypothetical protein